MKWTSTIFVTITSCDTYFFIFFGCPSRAAKKSGLEVRAPAPRERDSNEPLDDAAATQHRTRVTKQPSCEFLLVLDALALPWDA